MARYTGQRVVPISEGVHSVELSYRELSLVLDEATGDSYISKKPVPLGIELNNEEYWSKSSVYNQQLEKVDSELALKANQADIANTMDTKGKCYYSQLPTNTTNGDRWYCEDGDGTNGAGYYQWNGTTWFYAGSGQSYSQIEKEITEINNELDNCMKKGDTVELEIATKEQALACEDDTVVMTPYKTLIAIEEWGGSGTGGGGSTGATIPTMSSSFEGGSFSLNEAIETGETDVNKMTVGEYQDYMVGQSKILLAEYLGANPLVSDCHGGKTAVYSITEEKRNLFTSKFTSHTVKVQSGIADVMTWNATGEACEEWTDEECVKLICLWDSIVTPLVAYQQHVEIEIKAAASKEDVDLVEIDYSSADIRSISEV